MPPHAHRCGRCGALSMFGFGPPYGQRGATVHACADHRDDAEAWFQRTYHQQSITPALPQRDQPPAVSGRAPDAGQPDLFGGDG